jgi:hypothetical protein
LDHRFRIEEQKLAGATATAVVDPQADIHLPLGAISLASRKTGALKGADRQVQVVAHGPDEDLVVQRHIHQIA